jgi:predicted DNA-binding ribbon-helix-helix protein
MLDDNNLSQLIDHNAKNASTLISHNVMINGHRTSVRLEKEMWMGLKEIARREDCTVHMLCSAISQRKRSATSLTAAIRVFAMAYYQAAATDEGHQRAGHGAGAHSAASYLLQKHTNAPYYGLREFKRPMSNLADASALYNSGKGAEHIMVNSGG